jgi:DNA-binding CsgD family transcriptional regulator
MIIGRELETARVSQFLTELEAGPRVLLIEGEVGIGKTTVLQAGHESALQRGITVLSTSPVESEVPLEFAALADLLEMVPAGLIDQLPVPQRRAIREAVLRAEVQQGATDPRTVATAVLRLLQTLARERTVLLVIDDLPWMDAESARTLSFTLRRLRQDSVGLLAAVRTDWSGDQPPMATDGLPAVRMNRLRIPPLSLDAVRELLATRTALNPSRSLLLRLNEVSGGNPLFALELAARAHRDATAKLHDLLDVPASLRQLVLNRIDGLPSRARDVLLISALAAEPDVPIICAAARRPATAHAELEACIRSGTLVSTDGEVSFVHPLVRSVVIEDARPGDRCAAHRRLAGVAHNPEARARHLALAAEGPDESVAAELEAAAVLASRRGACDTAGDLAELAVALTPLGRAASRRRRVMLAAEQRFEASDPARACVLLDGIAGGMVPGPERAELWRRLARYRAVRGEPLAVWTTTLGHALEEAGDDEALRAMITMDHAVAASNAGRLGEAVRLGEMTLRLAVRIGDRSLEAQCRAGLAFAAFVLGRGLRPDLIGRALAGPEQPARLSMELRPSVAIGHIFHWAGDLDAARALYEKEYARAVEQGVETGLPLLLWAMAENEGWAGNWAQAELMAAEGCRLATDSGSQAGAALMSAVRGLLQAYRGQLETALRDAIRAQELALELGMPMVIGIAAQTFGVAALSQGNARAAHERLAPLADAAGTAGIAEPALSRFLPDEIEALTQLGDLDRAEQLLGPFAARAAQLGRDWGIATAGRCRGLLLAARGDTVGAKAEFDAALAVHRRMTMPFEEARTLLSAGRVERRARQKYTAVESLRGAEAIFKRLGAPLWQQLAADEIARVGTRTSTSAATGSDLTAAERRVADLAADGRTNAEIAAELFMGQRTVETHLYRAYRKLGVRSRTELCRMLVAAGGTPSY